MFLLLFCSTHCLCFFFLLAYFGLYPAVLQAGAFSQGAADLKTQALNNSLEDLSEEDKGELLMVGITVGQLGFKPAFFIGIFLNGRVWSLFSGAVQFFVLFLKKSPMVSCLGDLAAGIQGVNWVGVCLTILYTDF